MNQGPGGITGGPSVRNDTAAQAAKNEFLAACDVGVTKRVGLNPSSVTEAGQASLRLRG